ncbi:MAG: NAD(P)-dependent oxidoreductase [Armatimonadetes bacterium]|nr:NAD(P)-dependent oxidoreductase [Armatimonadota bacterium]
MKRIGFIGTGIMGQPMATNLLRKGFQVVAMAHRNRKPIEELMALGAEEAKSPKEVAERTDMCGLCLPTSREVEEVILGPKGLAESMKRGYVIADMGTSYPPDTRRLAPRVVERGGEWLDAPISGGPRGAAAGTLCIMVGGEASTLERCRDVLAAMGTNIFHFGPAGNGHMAKHIQNMIGIVHLTAIAEALTLAVKSGLNPEMVYQAVSVSASNSPGFQFMAPKVMKRDFETIAFRLDFAYKDLRQATAAAREAAIPLPVSNAAMELYQIARARGYGHLDETAVIRGLEEILGIEVRGDPKPPQ